MTRHTVIVWPEKRCRPLSEILKKGSRVIWEKLTGIWGEIILDFVAVLHPCAHDKSLDHVRHREAGFSAKLAQFLAALLVQLHRNDVGILALIRHTLPQNSTPFIQQFTAHFVATSTRIVTKSHLVKWEHGLMRRYAGKNPVAARAAPLRRFSKIPWGFTL